MAAELEDRAGRLGFQRLVADHRPFSGHPQVVNKPTRWQSDALGGVNRFVTGILGKGRHFTLQAVSLSARIPAIGRVCR